VAEAGTSEKAAAPPAVEPLLGRFTQADRRLLVITIAGTVLANLATVLVVGVALVMARQQKEAGGLGASGWAGLFVIPACLIGAVSPWRRQTAKIPSAAWLLRGMVIAAGFAATIYLLVLVGLASGLAG
jgi:hypothetical protein